MATPQLDTFTRAYLEAALWTSDPDPGSGEWSESDWWNIAAIDPASLAQAIEDCTAFQADNADDLAGAGTDERNGHDFWLTRNRHGAGFWDRGYGDIGRRLSDAAHVYGETNVTGPETDDNGSVTDEQYDAWDGVIYIQ